MWSDAQDIMKDGIRDSTKQTYKSAQRDYIKFCQLYNLVSLPTCEKTLMMYVTYLYQRNIRYNTIKVYLFAIRHMHVINGYDNPLTDNPRLQLSIKALQYKCNKSTEKLPMTYDILERIYRYINSNHDKQLVWSAMTLGFYGLLRAAEFTVPSASKFNPSVHLTVNDVSFRISDSGVRYISVMIKSSKTDKTSKGYLVHIGCSGKLVCAVCAMSSYLSCKSSLYLDHSHVLVHCIYSVRVLYCQSLYS